MGNQFADTFCFGVVACNFRRTNVSLNASGLQSSSGNEVDNEPGLSWNCQFRGSFDGAFASKTCRFQKNPFFVVFGFVVVDASYSYCVWFDSCD